MFRTSLPDSSTSPQWELSLPPNAYIYYSTYFNTRFFRAGASRKDSPTPDHPEALRPFSLARPECGPIQRRLVHRFKARPVYLVQFAEHTQDSCSRPTAFPVGVFVQIAKTERLRYTRGSGITSRLGTRFTSRITQIARMDSHTGRLTSLIVYGSLLIILAACARPDDTWEHIREVGVLRVGMDASFPPFEFIVADGRLAGFDVDLAQELGRRLEVEVEFVANLPADGLYDALAVGRVDVVISALVFNPDRMADFAYSASYFDAGQMLVVPARPPASLRGDGIEEMSDLSGHTLAVEFGTQGDLEARKWARRLPDLTVAPRETAAEALAAVVTGDADAALVDHVSALTAAGETSQVVIVKEPVVSEPYAVAVHRRSRYLLRAINDVLAEMEDDGTIAALVAEWLAVER
jgi:ABC-type amino acid transport substrate-binding protein